jgi:hypothetical protein
MNDANRYMKNIEKLYPVAEQRLGNEIPSFSLHKLEGQDDNRVSFGSSKNPSDNVERKASTLPGSLKKEFKKGIN